MTRLFPVAAKLLCVCTILMCGCIKAPNIVVLDRATALEREASGDFPKLQFELQRAGTTPRPAPVTREQLEQAGHPRPIVEHMETSDAERIDALLKVSCIGESKEGTLVETRDRCAVKEVPRLGSLLERANRDRAQIWEWLRRQRPARSLEEVRRAWRETHLRGVICGGEIQRDDGTWESKSC
jgi:hypothetical protein